MEAERKPPAQAPLRATAAGATAPPALTGRPSRAAANPAAAPRPAAKAEPKASSPVLLTAQQTSFRAASVTHRASEDVVHPGVDAPVSTAPAPPGYSAQMAPALAAAAVSLLLAIAAGLGLLLRYVQGFSFPRCQCLGPRRKTFPPEADELELKLRGSWPLPLAQVRVGHHKIRVSA